VGLVSIDLTTCMLATLFDFPFEERRKLPFWSDVATATPEETADGASVVSEERRRAMMECLGVFSDRGKQREGKSPSERLDLVTALANGEATRGMGPMEYLGTLATCDRAGFDGEANAICNPEWSDRPSTGSCRGGSA
jgi:cytochrome P450